MLVWLKDSKLLVNSSLIRDCNICPCDNNCVWPPPIMRAYGKHYSRSNALWYSPSRKQWLFKDSLGDWTWADTLDEKKCICGDVPSTLTVYAMLMQSFYGWPIYWSGSPLMSLLATYPDWPSTFVNEDTWLFADACSEHLYTLPYYNHIKFATCSNSDFCDISTSVSQSCGSLTLYPSPVIGEGNEVDLVHTFYQCRTPDDSYAASYPNFFLDNWYPFVRDMGLCPDWRSFFSTTFDDSSTLFSEFLYSGTKYPACCNPSFGYTCDCTSSLTTYTYFTFDFSHSDVYVDANEDDSLSGRTYHAMKFDNSICNVEYNLYSDTTSSLLASFTYPFKKPKMEQQECAEFSESCSSVDCSLIMATIGNIDDYWEGKPGYTSTGEPPQNVITVIKNCDESVSFCSDDFCGDCAYVLYQKEEITKTECQYTVYCDTYQAGISSENPICYTRLYKTFTIKKDTVLCGTALLETTAGWVQPSQTTPVQVTYTPNGGSPVQCYSEPNYIVPDLGCQAGMQKTNCTNCPGYYVYLLIIFASSTICSPTKRYVSQEFLEGYVADPASFFNDCFVSGSYSYKYVMLDGPYDSLSELRAAHTYCANANVTLHRTFYSDSSCSTFMYSEALELGLSNCYVDLLPQLTSMGCGFHDGTTYSTWNFTYNYCYS